MADRTYDIVLFGATGFTGGLTAEYLAEHAPDSLRWAIAGRSAAKLEAVRERLAKIDPRLSDLPLIEADSGDAASLRELAESTRVVISTVGPYALYGEPLVAACVDAGTDYTDLTGEPEFVDEIWLKYNDLAIKNGARIVHTSGFDSIPHDLGAYFTLLQLPEDVPVKISGTVKTGGRLSGGTLFSALLGFSRARQTIKAGRARAKLDVDPPGRRTSLQVRGVRRNPDGGWTAPLPTIDGFVVQRSAKSLDRYGPDFKYSHNMAASHLATIIGLGGMITVGFVAAQIPPLRRQIMKVQPPGTGPSAELRAKSWFKVRFTGEGGGKTVKTEFSGGDPGYSETSKMLAETGLALALDDIPDRAGQLTPVAACGDALLERLPQAGISIEVIEGEPAREPAAAN
ncbi:MAG: saccharopine dehydrogenase family protein [Solirubrobacterales bacterium]